MTCTLLSLSPSPMGSVAGSPVSGLAVTGGDQGCPVRWASLTGWGVRCLVLVSASDDAVSIDGVSPTIAVVWRRCLFTRLEVPMSRVTPLSARVVAAISDAQTRARLLFLEGGELS